ncbi:hypothetical protein D3C85_1692550 [compost metagenome]
MNAKVDTCHLFDSIHHGHAAPLRCQVHFMALVINLQGPQNLLGDMSNHALGQMHNVLVVSISFVQLNHCKFRIVAC